ncbi:MAG TPA: DedA family protein [Vicinamibacterales bacterium]|nr:DedA family protein [Vicinamibacterales bacterium]
MRELIDIFLNVDEHLADFVLAHGRLVYGLLFAVIFAETGLVVTPFLPGDSLLFAAGAIAATGTLNLWLVMIVLFVAAVLGDAVNYSVGRQIGPRVFRPEGRRGRLERLLNPKHLERTHEFFEKHGGKAVVMARFVPIVRTFIPFVAGAGSMTYPMFAFYNVTGGALWVLVCVGAGYLFGAIPVVKENFELVVVGIIAISVLPMAIEFFRQWRRR